MERQTTHIRSIVFTPVSNIKWSCFNILRIPTHSSLENLVPQFNKVVDRYFIDHLRDIANDNMTVDMKEVFSKVTLEVISWVRNVADFVFNLYFWLRLHLVWIVLKIVTLEQFVAHKIY